MTENKAHDRDLHHVFISNPYAGKDRDRRALNRAIQAAATKLRLPYEFHFTQNAQDAEAFVSSFAPGKNVRFYAIGGDGTLNDVANGILKREGRSELALIPRGTGNDFARFFDDPDFFENIERQMLAAAGPIDVIRTDAGLCGVNMINIGVDADTAAEVHRFDRYIPGPIAYIVALIDRVLLHKLGCAMEIGIDDEEPLRGDFLLVSFANGAFCGGGFKAAPKAVLDDGLMEICVVRPISKLTFAKMVGGYKNGTHLDDPRYRSFLSYRRGKKIRIKTEKPIQICIDGQIVKKTEFQAEILPQSINFVAPQ